MGFWAIAIAYTLRANLSFAITKMVTANDDETRESECLTDENGNSTEPVTYSIIDFNFRNLFYMFDTIYFRGWIKGNSTGQKKLKE